MTDKWAEYKEKFCGCKDASRLNSCRGLHNCELPVGHPERKQAQSAAPVQGEAALGSEQVLEIFERHGFRIELGASFSARGQIAQLLNAVGEIERMAAAKPDAEMVAEAGTKAVPVELLELIEQSWRVPNGFPKSVPEHVEQKITAGLSQLRSLLAAPSPQ